MVASVHQIVVPAHANIYEAGQRELTVTYAVPDNGCDSKTGLLLIITGFGESIETPYIQHAIHFLSDEYNVVTVVSQYFGYRYMGGIQQPSFTFDTRYIKGIVTNDDFIKVSNLKPYEVDSLLQILSHYPIQLIGHECLRERYEDFNDMGVMQALDNITAVLSVIEIMQIRGNSMDKSRIMAYGHGHGAYLAYLCNAFAPKLFFLIVDCSGWLFPPYMKSPRVLSGIYDKMTYSVTFDYLARKLTIDPFLLHIDKLYRLFRNQAHILCFHSIHEDRTIIEAKERFCNSIHSGMFIQISRDQVDDYSFIVQSEEIIFDFVNVFTYVMDNVKLESIGSGVLDQQVRFQTNDNRYEISYSRASLTFNQQALN